MRLHDSFRAGLAGTAAALILTAPAAYADLQDDMNARWRGAWLIIEGDISSNCNGMTTDNRISGDLASANGRFRFEPGELAQIRKVDVRRRRVDVLLDVHENVLIEYQDGPFTLYREAACEVELEIDFGSSRTRDLGVEGIEQQFNLWFERHARIDDARASINWNGREREDYPVGYQDTLIAYENWKVDQHNQLVAERIADSTEKTSLLLASVDDDREFGAGLAEGISGMRESMSDNCERLVASSPGTFGRSAEAPNEDWADGYSTGQQLAYHIELSRRLGKCYIATDETLAYLD